MLVIRSRGNPQLWSSSHLTAFVPFLIPALGNLKPAGFRLFIYEGMRCDSTVS